MCAGVRFRVVVFSAYLNVPNAPSFSPYFTMPDRDVRLCSLYTSVGNTPPLFASDVWKAGGYREPGVPSSQSEHHGGCKYVRLWFLRWNAEALRVRKAAK